MFYALYDFTASEGNPGHGFANSKGAVAFVTKEKMAAFLLERENFDFSARRITRKQAMTMLETVPGTNNKGLQLNKIGADEFVSLRISGS